MNNSGRASMTDSVNFLRKGIKESTPKSAKQQIPPTAPRFPKDVIPKEGRATAAEMENFLRTDRRARGR